MIHDYLAMEGTNEIKSNTNTNILTEIPWHGLGSFEDDPSWSGLVDEIEEEQDQHLIGGEESKRDRIDRILAVSGRVFVPRPTPSSECGERQAPVPITGQPVSKIAIEQRG